MAGKDLWEIIELAGSMIPEVISSVTLLTVLVSQEYSIQTEFLQLNVSPNVNFNLAQLK